MHIKKLAKAMNTILGLDPSIDLSPGTKNKDIQEDMIKNLDEIAPEEWEAEALFDMEGNEVDENFSDEEWAALKKLRPADDEYAGEESDEEPEPEESDEELPEDEEEEPEEEEPEEEEPEPAPKKRSRKPKKEDKPSPKKEKADKPKQAPKKEAEPEVKPACDTKKPMAEISLDEDDSDVIIVINVRKK